MSLYNDWQSLIEGQTDESFDEFWKKYCDTEIRIYTDLLTNFSDTVSGNTKELAEKYAADPILFTGFLDGISSSLKNKVELRDMTEESQLILDVDFEKLYFNMLEAKAEHLYTLSPWDCVLSQDKRNEIETAYRKSRTIIKDPKIGRNAPCPCGSGKKYKRCCGK